MTTIKEKLIFEGIGLHSGKKVVTILHPYNKEGIFFKFKEKIIQATADNVCDTSRCTMLNLDGNIIQTCEHLLASVYGLNINSILIENIGEEIPVFDGSGKIWCDKLINYISGTKEKPLSLKNSIEVRDGDAFITATSSDYFSINYTIDYSNPMIGKNQFEYTQDKFIKYIAPSRTFALYEEIEFLRANNLAKGGNEENCIVIYKDKLSIPLRPS